MTLDEAKAMVEEACKHLGEEMTEVSDPVSMRQIREFLAATDDWDPAYHDPEAARNGPYGGIIAPPMFYDAPLRAVVPQSELLEDGQYRDLAVPGIQGRSLAGGTDVELFEPVRVGDVITARTRVADLQVKEGRSGALVFQTTETTFTNQRGQTLAVRRRTNIFR